MVAISSFGFMGAHPRPCGEHRRKTVATVSPWGSSPPVRGALNSDLRDGAVFGLIPARAGSTA